MFSIKYLSQKKKISIDEDTCYILGQSVRFIIAGTQNVIFLCDWRHAHGDSCYFLILRGICFVK